MFSVPKKSATDLLLHIWKCIDLPKISKEDFIYMVSFKLFLLSPSKARKLIDQVIKRNYIVQDDNELMSLNPALEKTLSEWQEKRKKSISRKLQMGKEKSLNKDKELSANKDDLGSLLNAFLDKGTLNRAASVSSAAIVIHKLDKEKGIIDAEVSGSKDDPYKMKIDLNEKTIAHDCHDYVSRRAPSKKFCKHLAKLFLILGEEQEETSIYFLNAIAENINDWEF